MNLKIEAIKDAGSLDERVVFRAEDDCDVGAYFTFISHYTDVQTKRVSTEARAPFWFPDQAVKKGDYVVVYSKTGVNSSKENSDGSKSYFYYRGLSSAVCGDIVAPCGVLLLVSQWTSMGAETFRG